MAAALAPAAGTVALVPQVVATAATVLGPTAPAVLVLLPTAPIAESPDLIALGAELEVRIAAYRAAAEHLAEARATAARLWPEPPVAIVFLAGNRHACPSKDRYPGCFEEEADFEGREWPNIGAGGGQSSPLPRFIAVSGALAMLLDDARAEPEGFEDGFEEELVARIAEAEQYEEACWNAVEVSGIEEAKANAEACVEGLYDLANHVAEHPPRTLAGVLIHARALAGYADVEKSGVALSAPVRAATILGRGLAEAVLRVAGVKV
ncbi:MAG: hypothetical protein P4L99_05490 [Chthoniobacter sp.]|nr:hypothetical protein [Chthoniobacter sp.]